MQPDPSEFDFFNPKISTRITDGGGMHINKIDARIIILFFRNFLKVRVGVGFAGNILHTSRVIY